MPIDQTVIREGHRVAARLFLHKLPNGCLLVVGRTMNDLDKMTTLVLRTIGSGLIIALLLAVGGTVYFRYQLGRRVEAIRKTVVEIEAGNLAKRIPEPHDEDEFTRLGAELNRMLDKIENLMAGVRHISNVVAHNIRTPLCRIRSRLDEALRGGVDATQLKKVAEFSIEEVDGLIIVFDKLLQIAESESETHCRPFATVALREVVTNVVELYDAIAEAKGITLFTNIEGEPETIGDKDLLASAFANLLDNALKYGARSVTINVKEIRYLKIVSLAVQDNGPGIPAEERSKVVQRFYRLNRTVPGTGLGLSIVSAIAHLHRATLHLEDAAPGLLASLDLPLPPNKV